MLFTLVEFCPIIACAAPQSCEKPRKSVGMAVAAIPWLTTAVAITPAGSFSRIVAYSSRQKGCFNTKTLVHCWHFLCFAGVSSCSNKINPPTIEQNTSRFKMANKIIFATLFIGNRNPPTIITQNKSTEDAVNDFINFGVMR